MADQHTTAYEQLKYKLKLRLSKLLQGEEENGRASHLSRDIISTQLRLVLSNSPTDSQRLALSADEQEQLIEDVASEIIGIGPLEALLADPDISEIMVNGPQQVFVERNGRIERTSVAFQDDNHLMSVIERLLDPTRMTVTEAEPCVDASLPDGTRINVIIPPLVLNGPTVTIRKRLRLMEMGDFVHLSSLSQQAAEFLENCVKAKVNIVISGGTSTGKTTLVSALSAFIPPAERIITIENTAELELPTHEHWLRLVARPPNIEGRGEVSIRALVRNALRMRPDRIILGEARSGEALDVIQAMHTGHAGVITVIHADSPQAALERLEMLMLMSGLDLPPQACRTQIASAVDLVVHLGRFADGSRRVASIAEAAGGTSGVFQLAELFRFEIRGFRPDGSLEGGLVSTGILPTFLKKFQLNNIPIPTWLTAP